MIREKTDGWMYFYTRQSLSYLVFRRKVRYSGTPRNIYRHILISEIKEASAVLPAVGVLLFLLLISLGEEYFWYSKIKMLAVNRPQPNNLPWSCARFRSKPWWDLWKWLMARFSIQQVKALRPIIHKAIFDFKSKFSNVTLNLFFGNRNKKFCPSLRHYLTTKVSKFEIPVPKFMHDTMILSFWLKVWNGLVESARDTLLTGVNYVSLIGQPWINVLNLF